MSLAITCTVRDSASPAVRGIEADLGGVALHKEIGEAGVVMTARHLRGLGKNKRGWPTTNFWPRAAKATSWSASANTVTITINQIGVRQRYHGGVIAAVNKQFLTIPISPQAYGHTASDFPGAFLIKTAKGAYLVQYGQSVGKTGKVGRASSRAASLEFLFKLVKSVNQRPDPGVIPADDAYVAMVEKQVARIVNRRKSANN